MRSGWNLGRNGVDLRVKVQGDGWEKDPRGLGDGGARAEGAGERAQGRDLPISDTETWAGASMSSSGMCGRPRQGLG